MEVPKIIVDGKEYTPDEPKAIVWRHLMEFSDKQGEYMSNDWLDKYSVIISEVFARPEITPEAVLFNVQLNDIIPLYKICFDWVIAHVTEKLGKIPNAKTVEG